MLSIGVILFAVVVLLLVYIIYRNHTHLNKIPKPPCSILLGHASDLRDPTKILKLWTNYTIRYGGLLRIYIPPVRPSVIITNPEVLQLILSSNKELQKSKDYRYCRPWLGTGLVTSDVEEWKHHRRLLTPCFARLSLLKHFINVFDSFGDVLMEKLNREVNNEDIDIFPLIKMYSLDILCETSMGLSINAQNNNDGEYVTSIDKMCQIITNRARNPCKRYDFLHFFTKDYKIQSKAVNIINTFFSDIMNNKKENTVTDEAKEDHNEDKSRLSFLDLLIKLHEEDGQFTLENIKDEVNTFLFGGHDTTATGIAFTLYALARHAEIQEKVIEEQVNLFGKLKNKPPTYDDLQSMKYLELVIYEALRLFPPIPMIGRRLTNEIRLENGVILPKNLNLCLFIYGCHHNPKYFPEPEKFIPERFAKNDDISAFSFIPFSAGPRNCVGQKFAILQMKSCISKIIRNFKLQPSNPEYELELIPRLSLFSKNGIRLSLKRRLSMSD